MKLQNVFYNLLIIISMYLVVGEYTQIENGGLCKGFVDLVISPVIKNNGSRELRVIWWIPRSSWNRNNSISIFKAGRIAYSTSSPSSTGELNLGLFLDENQPFDTNVSYTAKYKLSTGKDISARLQQYPFWMNYHRMKIQHLKLHQLFVPGTHNSGSYAENNNTYFGERIDKYVFTQDQTIEQQLEQGARFLDLRVAYHNNTVEWYLNHGFLTVRPLTIALKQIKNFVQNSNEIVILNFHEFPVGFESPEIHEKFAQYLKQEFSNLLFTPTASDPWLTTLREIWESNRRLLIAYNNWYTAFDATTRTYQFFPPVKQIWGNSQTLRKLVSHFDTSLPRDYNTTVSTTAAMSELTATTTGVLLDLYKGLRYMANLVNTNITCSYYSRWRNRAQVVAVDFLQSTGIVPVAIHLNLIRAGALNC